MAVNKYFNRVSQEQEQKLFEGLLEEFIQFGGVDVLYLPRENFELDPILKEPKKTVWQRAFPIEVYIPDGGNFQGEQNIMSKIGFRINQTTELVMSKKRFNELGTGRKRPKEGDLIFIGDPDDPHGTFTNSLFEINQVWYNEPNWQFGKQLDFKLHCELWTGDYSKFSTGVTALDNLNPNNDYEVSTGINADVIEKKIGLLQFDTNNPFTDF